MLFLDKIVKLITGLNHSKLVYSPIEENTTVRVFSVVYFETTFYNTIETMGRNTAKHS